MNFPPRSRFTPDRRRRGSVLIVALLFAAVIAISLGSYLRLATSATKLSYRTHYQGVAMNIAETGLEHAMWEMNRGASAWSDWTAAGSAGAYRRSFDLGTVEGGAKAEVKVYARDRNSGGPAWIVARSIVTPPQGTPIEKWVRVTLQKRSRSAVGGLGRDGIVANGNQVVMGSWNSDPDRDPATPPIPYSEAVANDEMALATTNFDATLSAGNADINGKAAVGADEENLDRAIQVGPQGYIGPFGTPAGTKDANSVSANFSADLPIPEPPPGKTYTSLGTVSSATTLPGPGHTPDADGVYYYSANEISLNGSALTISPGAEVVLHVTKSAGTSISLGGNGGAVTVSGSLVTNTLTGDTTYTTGKLKIYTAGDISVTGQAGMTNSIATQTYNPQTSSTTTTISNVQPVYGKGQQKNTVIGWTYTQSVTAKTTVAGNTTTKTTTNNYKVLIDSGVTTAPVAGTTGPVVSDGGTIVNTGSYVGQPDNLRIYGTRTNDDVSTYGAQSIKIAGNGSLSAVVDAPNANISAKGGGNSGFVYGSLIGKSLTFTGNDCFYFDESLIASDADARLGIEDWDEMVSYADRNTYAAYMNF